MKKYSKVFGEVEVIDNNGTISTVKIVKTGEIKKLVNSHANLQDEPFAKEVKKKAAPARELTNEDKAHLAYINRNGSLLENVIKKSTTNYRNGKSGLTSLTK